jgi:hypothetical protein
MVQPTVQKIVPRGRAADEMLRQVKFDVAKLEAAFRGTGSKEE